jgi:hypothetical protein
MRRGADAVDMLATCSCRCVRCRVGRVKGGEKAQTVREHVWDTTRILKPEFGWKLCCLALHQNQRRTWHAAKPDNHARLTVCWLGGIIDMNTDCKSQLDISAIGTFCEERPVVFPGSRENLGLRVTRCREICHVFEILRPDSVMIDSVRMERSSHHEHLQCGASVPQLF